MADRYWVGGSGSWNSTTKWSTTSGGASGASVPTASDNAIFDANSGTSHYTVTVTDNSTCADLTFTPEPIAGVTQFAVGLNFVIAGTFSTSGTQGNRRVWFRSSTYGLTRDMQIATIGTVTDVDFRDIRITGTGGTLTGTRIGDLRGNSGITFSTPKTVYWNLAGNNSWNSDAWADTSGGTPNTDNFPLAQDTAVFDQNSAITQVNIFNFTGDYTGSVDMSARTSAMTMQISNAGSVYGDWKNGSGTTLTNAVAVTFSGRNTQVITSAGKTFSGPITIDSYGGTVELADALNIGSQTLTVTNGTFDTKGYNVTAVQLSSSNINVREIKLGSSTVTTSAGVNFTSSQNMTLDAGTSSISITDAIAAFYGGNQTFYDVSFISVGVGSNTHTIGQSNTFNNLSIAAPAGASMRQVVFNGNQTITGTLTVAGASAVRRIMLRSDTVGGTRTLTVGTLSADDCDFRDITIAGTAAGSSPTRAGDCGGNSGITFPAAKTVYWNLSGTQNWTADGWATSSGGSPATNNFPLAQDTAVFDDTGSAGTVSTNGVFNIGSIDASARTSAMTLNAGNAAPFLYGNWTMGSGVTLGSGGTVTFLGRGTTTITNNGTTFNSSLTINCGTGTVQLADALELNSARTLTLTSGTFDAVTYNVTAGLFTASAASTLKMGSGMWTLAGTGQVWSIPSNINAFYKSTADILLSSTSTSARSFNGNGLSYNKLTIGGATGTSTLTISGNNSFTELASTKTVAHTIALGTTTQTFGKWSVTGTSGNEVTLTGSGIGHSLAGPCTSGIDYLAIGSIRFSASSPGEFYAGANSTATGTPDAPTYLTDKPADSTRYWVGGTGNWNDTNMWSTTSGGAGGADLPRSHDDVVFDSNSNATDYTATVNAITGGNRCKALTIAGPASGNVTLAGFTALYVHDDITLPATGLTRTYSGNITLSGTGAGKTITTNGVALSSSSIGVNGVGAEWTLASALNIGIQTFSVARGSFDCDTYNLTCGSFSSTGTTTRTIDFGSSTITFSGNTALNFGTTESAIANLTFTAGTSQITLSNSVADLIGNGQTFYNVSFTSGDVNTVEILGANTFNDLSIAGAATTGMRGVLLHADQTINGTLTLSAGTNATRRTFVQSNTIGETRTLTCNAVASLTDIDFRDITIAGLAAPVSGTRLGDCKGNSGITFGAGANKYWNLAGGGNSNWSALAWATSSGGAVSHDNFPLAQDTCIFEAGSPVSGSTVTLDAVYNVGTIDMSARTTNTLTFSGQCALYGNWINGTGVTLTGTGLLTIAGRTSQTITSAGVTFTHLITIDTPGGSVTLQDAFEANRSSATAFTLRSGTFDANGYNVTLSGASSGVNLDDTTTTRTVAIGSGTWTIAGSGSGAWDATPSTNLTVTGTGTIRLTASASKNFNGGGLDYSGITLDQGGAGLLTVAQNNTFADVTNSYSATGATTISFTTGTQRLGAFSAAGTASNVLTIRGSSATNPCNLIFTGTGAATASNTDYLTLTGVRAYPLADTWYAGTNSTNEGTLGWSFTATPVTAPTGNFLMLFL